MAVTWILTNNSIYQLDPDYLQIRRITGLKPPTARFKPDGTWHTYQRLKTRAVDPLHAPTGPGEMVIRWEHEDDNLGAATTLPTIARATKTRIWGGSLWVAPGGGNPDNPDGWMVVAAGQPVAWCALPTTALMLAAMLHEAGPVTETALALAASAVSAPINYTGVDDPELDNPDAMVWPVSHDGWTRPWNPPTGTQIQRR